MNRYFISEIDKIFSSGTSWEILERIKGYSPRLVATSVRKDDARMIVRTLNKVLPDAGKGKGNGFWQGDIKKRMVSDGNL